MSDHKKSILEQLGRIADMAGESSELKELVKTCMKYVEKQSFDLGERVKELRCQNQLSEIFADHSFNLDIIAAKVVEIIPPAWQFPEYTGAMIKVRDNVYKTENFNEDAPCLVENLKSDETVAGLVKVCYTGEIRGDGFEFFLKEEYDLIRSIALRLSNMISLCENEEALKRGENRYQSILAASPDVITITDLEGRILFASERARQMFDYDAGYDFRGHTLFEYVDSSGHAKAMEEIGKMMNGRLAGAAEYLGIRHDGSRFEIEVNGEIIRDDSGQPSQFIFVTRDISSRKKIEQDLRKSEEKYRSLIDSSDAAIMMIDPEGYYIYMNSIAAKPFDLPAVKIPGVQVSDLFPEKIAEQILSNVRQVIKENKGLVIEEEILVKGESRWYRTSAQPVRNENGAPFAAMLYATDITTAKQAEILIRQSEEKYRIIYETIRDVYYEATPDGVILELSPSVNLLSKGQYTREELIGTSFFDFFYNEEEKDRFARVLSQKGGIDDFEALFRNRDGSPVPVSFSCSFFYDNEGETRKITGSVRDISERRKAIEELRKFRMITDKANYGVAIALPDGEILYLNPWWLKMHGYENEDLTGRNIAIFHSGKQIEEVSEGLRMLFEKGEFESLEVGHTRKDGSTFPTLMSAVVVVENGRPLYMSATAIDITEMIKSGEKLRLSEEKLNYAQEIAQMASWDLSMETYEVNWSRNYYKMIGRESRDFPPTQENFYKILHPDDHTAINNKLQSIMVNRMPDSMDMRIIMPDGSIKWVTNHIVPEFDGEKLVWLHGVNIDITDRKKAEETILEMNSSLEERIIERTAQLAATNEEVHKARIEAEEANMAKSEFLSRMSHELRTPMNSILGFAQILNRGEMEHGQRKAVNHILKSGRHLLDLINEVLDISRIEAGKISISPEPVQIYGVIHEITDIVHPQALARQLTVEFIENGIEQYYVMADRQRLVQILLNLVNNAVKYNRDQGDISIIAECFHTGEDGNDVIRISVNDTGLGIEPENLPKLFIPFERIGAENSGTEGSGLGLAVVKKLIDLMGGRVGVESLPGNGSTFWIELPRAEVETESRNIGKRKRAENGQEGTRHGTILYIEDNRPNIELVQYILETSWPGVRLVTTMFGKQGPVLAKEYNPDLILLDLNLPDIHGREVLKNLKSDPLTNMIPVIVITADAITAHLEPLIMEGAMEYLTKPFDIERFMRVLDRVIRKSDL